MRTAALRQQTLLREARHGCTQRSVPCSAHRRTAQASRRLASGVDPECACSGLFAGSVPSSLEGTSARAKSCWHKGCRCSRTARAGAGSFFNRSRSLDSSPCCMRVEGLQGCEWSQGQRGIARRESESLRRGWRCTRRTPQASCQAPQGLNSSSGSADVVYPTPGAT